MSKLKKWIFGTAVLVGVTAGALAWLANSSRAQKLELPPDPALAARDPAAVTVTAEPVRVMAVPRNVEAVGTLWGFEEIALSAKVEGQVKRLVHLVGDRVAPNELLLEIDPTNYELAKRQAERSLEVELARLGLRELPPATFDVSTLPAVIAAKARLEQARGKYERILAVGSVASREELADKAAEFRVAEAEANNQIQLAKSGLVTVQLRQEALRSAEQQLKDTLVVAPTPTQKIPGSESGVSYVVSQRNVAEGTFVRLGTELYRLAIDQTLKLRVAVPERYGPDIKAGQKVDVTTAAFARPFEGVVALVYPTVDPNTRTFDVEIHVANPNRELKPGSFAKAAIRTRVDPDAVTVPLEAIVEFAGITKVFVVENGKAKEVQVVQGVQTTKWVEILRPKLAKGTRVVISGQSALADGTPVMERKPK